MTDLLLLFLSHLHTHIYTQEARKRFTDALLFCRYFLPTGHQDTALCLRKLGVLLLDQNDAPGAIRHLTEALTYYTSMDDKLSAESVRELIRRALLIPQSSSSSSSSSSSLSSSSGGAAAAVEEEDRRHNNNSCSSEEEEEDNMCMMESE